VGILSGEQAEVVSPALTGSVVTVGQHLLDDGSAVLLPGSADAGGGAGGPPKARTPNRPPPTAKPAKEGGA